jgi:hypothetical protein
METYKRVHVEDTRRITSEVSETNLGRRIGLLIQEDSRCSMTLGLHLGSLEDAKKRADQVIDHTCDARCGEWERM